MREKCGFTFRVIKLPSGLIELILVLGVWLMVETLARMVLLVAVAVSIVKNPLLTYALFHP